MLAADAKAAGATFVDTYTPTTGQPLLPAGDDQGRGGPAPRLPGPPVPPQRPSSPGITTKRSLRGHPDVVEPARPEPAVQLPGGQVGVDAGRARSPLSRVGPYAGERASRLRRVLARTRRQGDNGGMARDDSKARAAAAWPLCPFWTGPGPRGRSDGCPLSPPSLPRPPPGPGTGPLDAGSGPWQSGQALLASGWWRGALARKRRPGPRCKRTSRPGRDGRRQRRDFCASLAQGPRLPPGRKHLRPAGLSRFFRLVSSLVSPVAWMVIGVPWRLRHPRRLTVLAIASEAPNVVFSVLRAARAVQRRRPRIAAGSALVAAGSVARLRAASAEPLR